MKRDMAKRREQRDKALHRTGWDRPSLRLPTSPRVVPDDLGPISAPIKLAPSELLDALHAHQLAAGERAKIIEGCVKRSECFCLGSQNQRHLRCGNFRPKEEP